MKTPTPTIMNEIKKIVVFDTETSGLCEGFNTLLSLSWQVLDADLEKVAEESRFFDWPEEKCRIQERAIEVNGLTRERLAELGTCDKRAALQEFAEVIDGADLLVAHNGGFDVGFVRADAKEANVTINLKKPMFDTMLEMTDYCRIPRGNGEYKWPRLAELADCLDIDTHDIDWHQSASDVEVTVRCFRKIVEKGYLDRFMKKH